MNWLIEPKSDKHQLAAAVRTDIVVRAQASVAVADDDKAFVEDVEFNEIARLAKVGFDRREKPGASPYCGPIPPS